MPVDIQCLTEGWLELESDPGLFTLLVEDFGCKGVQVEEIYDLQKPSLVEGPVFGFIFLFKWTEERKSRTRGSSRTENKNPHPGENEAIFVEDEEKLKSIFFAQQIIPNSCATHSLISVLLNNPSVELGPVLSRLKVETCGMNAENKGHAIGNTPELAAAHNSHASFYDVPDQSNNTEKMPAATTARSSANNQLRTTTTADSFHFVSFLPIKGRLYELDGLKRLPLDHGPIGENQDWTEKFRRIITTRIAQETQGSNNDSAAPDIRYNLMAVVPDKRVTLSNKLRNLKSNRHFILQALEKIMRPTRLPEALDVHNYSKYPSDAEFNSTLTGVVTPPEKPLTVDTTICPNTTTSSVFTNSLTLPLSIQTTLSSISPALSTSSSTTDTCSEASSAFNSPTPKGSVVINPNERITKLFVCKVVGSSPEISNDKSTELAQTSSKALSLSENFSPRDLISLLKALEEEIDLCESQLKEELEKRQRYRVDDSRRTHNYDDFITMFILMLSEQGKLPNLLDKALNSSSTNPYDVPADSPQSPSRTFFSELHSAYGKVCSGVIEDDEDLDIAEFMSKLRPENGLETKTAASGQEEPKSPALSLSTNPPSVKRMNGSSGRRRRRQSPLSQVITSTKSNGGPLSSPTSGRSSRFRRRIRLT